MSRSLMSVFRKRLHRFLGEIASQRGIGQESSAGLLINLSHQLSPLGIHEAHASQVQTKFLRPPGRFQRPPGTIDLTDPRSCNFSLQLDGYGSQVFLNGDSEHALPGFRLFLPAASTKADNEPKRDAAHME